MRKIFVIGLMIVIGNVLYAQTEADVVTGAGYADEVYYSFENGSITTISRTNWDIAFITAQMSISILANNGSGVELYTYPNGDISAWNTLDTTGMTWKPMYNSIETFEEGAFTVHEKGHPDYGWGIYNMETHVITGDSLYVITTVNGNYKKLWIKEKNAIANTWTFVHADLNGDNEVEETLDAGEYNSKNFIYYSLDSARVEDREPASDQWELLFTRYFDYNIPYFVSGVLTNEYGNVECLEIKEEGLQQDTTVTYDKNLFTSDISIIGSDWKSFNMQTFQYDIATDVVYFVKRQVGNVATYRKLYFTGFGGSADGTYTFMQQDMEVAVSDGPEKITGFFELYPNPSSDYIHLIYDSEEEIEISLYDISGKQVKVIKSAGSGFTRQRFDISDLTDGLYIVKVQAGMDVQTLKFIKE